VIPKKISASRHSSRKLIPQPVLISGLKFVIHVRQYLGRGGDYLKDFGAGLDVWGGRVTFPEITTKRLNSFILLPKPLVDPFERELLPVNQWAPPVHQFIKSQGFF
jgi:hypothetical protein